MPSHTKRGDEIRFFFCFFLTTYNKDRTYSVNKQQRMLGFSPYLSRHKSFSLSFDISPINKVSFSWLYDNFSPPVTCFIKAVLLQEGVRNICCSWIETGSAINRNRQSWGEGLRFEWLTLTLKILKDQQANSSFVKSKKSKYIRGRPIGIQWKFEPLSYTTYYNII
jgi:hypothetical protein